MVTAYEAAVNKGRAYLRDVAQAQRRERLVLPIVKWWCRNYRTPGPTRSALIARANREVRYDRLNQRAGRHQHPWSDATPDVNEVVIHRRAKHRAGVMLPEDQQVDLYRISIPLMLAD